MHNCTLENGNEAIGPLSQGDWNRNMRKVIDCSVNEEICGKKDNTGWTRWRTPVIPAL